jgi:Fe/S biogenesis protein NfuA
MRGMQPPELNFTDAAGSKVRELLAAQEQPDLALRIRVLGRGAGLRYDLQLVAPEEIGAEDLVVEPAGFKVVVDRDSVPKISGAKIDFVDELMQSGFSIDNPNATWSDPVAAEVQRVLDTQINPGVASHGGQVTLLDVQDGVAYIQFAGGCHGCGMASVTLKQGVEVMIKEAVPAVQKVVDITDHSSGDNPYYRSAAAGESPLQS